MEKFVPVENADLKQYNDELEKRLLALWEKYHSDSNYYMERIKRLEKAGDAMANDHNPFTFIDWQKAKETKP